MENLLKLTERVDIAIEIGESYYREFKSGFEGPPEKKSPRKLSEIKYDIAKTLVATMHKMHRASIDNYVTVDGRLRRLTPRECLRLMGFPDTFKQVVSDVQTYKQAGNSIVVDVLMELTKQILKTGVFDKNT